MKLLQVSHLAGPFIDDFSSHCPPCFSPLLEVPVWIMVVFWLHASAIILPSNNEDIKLIFLLSAHIMVRLICVPPFSLPVQG